MLNKIALKRLGTWPVSATEPNEMQGQMLRLEIGQLGYYITNPEHFTSISSDEFQILRDTLLELRGGNVQYIPLFTGFPDEVPNDDEYFFRRVLGLFFGFNTFNYARFGADPITQMQQSDLFQQAVEAQQKRLSDSHTEWRSIQLVSDQECHRLLGQWVQQHLYSSTPVKEALWEDIFQVLHRLSVDVDLTQVRVKETLARLAVDRWLLDGTISAKTPTDLLRMFACLQGQDISLAKPIRLQGLKLSKPQRREIIRFLNSCPALEEDLLRYQGLWISVANYLHPGDLAHKYPRVAQAFDDLRNDRIQSFEAQAHALSGLQRARKFIERPSVFLRHLNWLRQEVSTEELIHLVQQLNPEELPIPLLVTAFCAINDDGPKAYINKKGKAFVPPVQVTADRLRQLKELQQEDTDVEERLQLLDALDTLIVRKLQGTQNWESVWLDPRLDQLVLPFQVRKQSDGCLNLARGSRMSIGECDVLRLFTYWHQESERTDLDLSVLALDEQFQYAGQVSWNAYGDGKDIQHSGDIQSAPQGAAEFIDIRLTALDPAYHYLLPSTIHFHGEKFTQLKACYAGWMLRNECGSDTLTFDPKTVAEKVEINQDGKSWIPFLIDIKRREIVLVDLYSKGARKIEDNAHFPRLATVLSRYTLAKPTFGRLADWYCRANQIERVERHQAKVTIGLDSECTINVLKLVGQAVTSFS